MAGIEGYWFDECFRVASIAEILNIPVPIIQINPLITGKKSVNRSKDQIAVIELEKILKLPKAMGPD